MGQRFGNTLLACVAERLTFQLTALLVNGLGFWEVGDLLPLKWDHISGQVGSFTSKEFRPMEGEVKLVTKGRQSGPSLQTTFAFLIKLTHMIPIISLSSPRAVGYGVG